MKDLVIAELYKFKKKNIFLFVVLFNVVSLIYALGAKFNWGWVNINGKYDLIQYVGAIWQLLFLLGLPMIFLLFNGANILGGEKAAGQILLEVTRAADRKKLISAKIISTIILTVTYFVSNIVFSCLSYMLFIKNSQYGSSKTIILNGDNIELITTCLFGLVFIIILTIAVMRISINYGAIPSTLIGIGIYAVSMLISKIAVVNTFLPGYYALSQTAQISSSTTIKQIIVSIIFITGIVASCRKRLPKIDL